jgi:hypothetical protein
MELIKEFSQSDLIDQYEEKAETKLPTPGICFRVTFKWAACMFFGGEFKYDQLNVVKTANKHVAYRQKTLQAAEKTKDFDDTTFGSYVDLDGEETLNFINTWGVQIKDAKKTVYQGLYVAQRLKVPLWDYLSSSKNWATETLIQTFYGRKIVDSARRPAGHAIAFYGPGPWLFDANDGVYSFDATDGPGIGAEIKDYLETDYTSFPHEKFLLSRLGSRI